MKKQTASKKEVDKKSTRHKAERDQYTVVLEDLQSQFRVFGEGLNYMSNSMDEQRKDMKELRSDMEMLKAEVALIRHNQVTRDEFKLLEARVARLERVRR